jgi:Capsule assembly protein Wzi
MRSTRPPFFSFIFILLVGLLVSKPLLAQKKFSLPKIHFGMPHFKPLFKKDSTNKLFNPNHWFKYKKEQPYTKNENAMPIAVGYTDFDDNIRDLQLLGKLPTENSLTIRPYILPKSVTYDSLLKAIDPSIRNNGHLVQKKHFDLQLLPVNFLQKYNSHHPYGWNDGPLSFSKGYQYLVSGGVYMHWRNIHLTLRPEYFHTATDKYDTSFYWGQINPSLNKLIFGQSNLRIDLGPIGFTAGTNNMWRGPGIISSLLMTNNAQGFQHIGLNTIRPIKTPFGSIELSIFGATLTQNATQGFENKYLKTASINKNTRYINMLTIAYSPLFFKNFYLGANRVFHQFSRTTPSTNFKKDYLPVTLPLFRNVYQDNAEAIDQVLSGFVKYTFPKEHAELYFEYGWNDGSSNARDLTIDNSHSSASVLGFRKIQYFNHNSFLSIAFEATRMAQTPSYLQRNAGNWYEHGMLFEGYTNENQILGAGSGFGNNIQSLSVDWNKNWNKIGIKVQHISINPIGKVDLFDGNGGFPVWDDFTYGIILKHRLKNILFNANIDWVHSDNYLWQKNNKRENFHFFLNTIFLW